MNKKITLLTICIILLSAIVSFSQTIERVGFSSSTSNNENFQMQIGTQFSKSINSNSGLITISSEYGEAIFYGGDLTSDNHFRIDDGISVYPNPTNYGINIVIENADQLDGAKLVELYDINGRLLLSKPIEKSSKEIPLNVSVLKAGTYIIQIGNTSTKITKK